LTEASPEVERRLRAASFGAVADEYERSRPGYPEDAVRWITGEDPVEVLDLAAGTGKLTRQLHAAGHAVVAVDPSLEMLGRLQAATPSIPAAAGRAESIPCRSERFDVITIAQAWHWFDNQRASEEVARVLRPGGYACILWNFRDESTDWVAKLSEIIGSEGTSEDETDDDPLGHCTAFAPSVRRSFTFDQPLDRDLLVALVKSRSYVATLPPDGQRRVLDRVHELCDQHAELAGRERFAMPYLTKVYRAERVR
jgi:SAM-dependent methyltransferase